MTTANPFQFTDRKGRVWDTGLDLLKVRRVDNSNFSEIIDYKFCLARFDKTVIAKLLTNSPLLFAVIWVLVQDQVREKYEAYKAALESSPVRTPPPDSFPVDPVEDPGEAEREFISAITGGVIDDARQAFLEALSDFFRDQQTALSTVSKTLRLMRQKLVEKAKEIDPMMDQMMDQELNKAVANLQRMLYETPGTESTPSPPLPAGIPATSTGLESVLET